MSTVANGTLALIRAHRGVRPLRVAGSDASGFDFLDFLWKVRDVVTNDPSRAPAPRAPMPAPPPARTSGSELDSARAALRDAYAKTRPYLNLAKEEEDKLSQALAEKFGWEPPGGWKAWILGTGAFLVLLVVTPWLMAPAAVAVGGFKR